MNLINSFSSSDTATLGKIDILHEHKYSCEQFSGLTVRVLEAAAVKAQVSKAEAAKVIDAALEAAVEAVKKGEGLQLIGYISLGVANRAARVRKTRVPALLLTFRQRKLLRLNWVLNSLSN